MEEIKENTSNVFVLPENFTISECQEQYSQLMEELSNNENMQLDISKVKHVDTASLQLLASFIKSNGAEDYKIIGHTDSCELKEHANMLGLSSYLNINW